jgi:hypothetical protein
VTKRYTLAHWVARLAGISLTLYLNSRAGWFSGQDGVEDVADWVGDEILELERELGGWGAFSYGW